MEHYILTIISDSDVSMSAAWSCNAAMPMLYVQHIIEDSYLAAADVHDRDIE